MQEGADFARWNHTAAVQATIANTVRDSKKRRDPFYSRDFHPHLIKRAEDKRKAKKESGSKDDFSTVSISILRDVFVDQKPIEEIEETHGI